MVWQAAGEPDPPNPSLFQPGEATCVMCGRKVGLSAPTAKAIGGNFTDQYLYSAPHSTRVCPACQWCCGGKPPATLRMWSVVVAPGVSLPASQPKAWLGQNTPGLCLANRADPSPVADILLAPPATAWAVGVALSTQKHVLPYTRVNQGDGVWTVRLENTDVTASPDLWRRVLGTAAALRAAGHGGEQVREGRPDPRAAKTGHELEAWRRLNSRLAGFHRSPLLDLALWCCVRITIGRYAALAEEAPHVDR